MHSILKLMYLLCHSARLHFKRHVEIIFKTYVLRQRPETTNKHKLYSQKPTNKNCGSIVTSVSAMPISSQFNLKHCDQLLLSLQSMHLQVNPFRNWLKLHFCCCFFLLSHFNSIQYMRFYQFYSSDSATTILSNCNWLLIAHEPANGCVCVSYLCRFITNYYNKIRRPQWTEKWQWTRFKRKETKL